MSFIWTIVIGFIVGLLARFVMPGDDKMGIIMTTILGVVGSLAATYIGQMMGWYRPDQGAGFITATLGAIVVLFIWNRLVARGAIPDPGVRDPRV